MSKPLTNYTNTDAVRGAIGLTDNEVTDEMLVEQNLGPALIFELNDWVPTHKTIYQAGRVEGATDDEETQYRLLQLYSMWWCACRAAKMVLAIPEKISDGKAEMKRFNDLDLAGIAAEACGMAVYYQKQLQEELGETVDSSGHTLFGSAAPDYDPVTNEGA